MSSEVTLSIDGREAKIPAGSTILDAARTLGIDIPTLCWIPTKKPGDASCLVCAVEVEGMRRLVPACATCAQAGMKVHTDGEKVARQRRVALELLLSDHVGDCIAPCETVCPAHLDIPAMNQAILQDRMDEAVRIVKDTIPLPATLGRICPTPCEGRCRRKGLDGAVSVCLLKRYVGDYDAARETPFVPPVPTATGKRVAVVGAGPAGLSAAYFLRLRGHACTVYDEQERAGGALRTAIPEEVLPREVLDREIAVLEAMGIEFRLGRRVALDEIEGDAVVLAVGPLKPNSELDAIDRTDRGIKVRKGTGETSVKGIFAAGAAVAPGRIAIRSIGDGHQVAEAVHAYLTGEKPTPGAWQMDAGKNAADFATPRMTFASREPRTDPVDGFNEAEAKAAAQRCLQCGCAKSDACVLRGLATRYQADPGHYRLGNRSIEIDDSHEEVVLEESKCIRCGICVQIAAEHHERIGLAFRGRGFDMTVGGPFGEPLAKALRVAALECAAACPTSALYVRPKRG